MCEDGDGCVIIRNILTERSAELQQRYEAWQDACVSQEKLEVELPPRQHRLADVKPAIS